METFQKKDEICQSCLKRWTDKDMMPKILVQLPSTTMRKKIDVVVCPYCDGEPVAKLSSDFHR